MFKVKSVKFFTLALVMSLFAFSSQAFADSAIYTGLFGNKALKGYDTCLLYTSPSPRDS